jgi:hypothetical protein
MFVVFVVLLIEVEQNFTVTIQNLKTDRDRCLSRASLHGSIFEAPPRHHHPRFDGDNLYRRQIVKNPCERPRAVWR